jgi:hypothetical protein
VSGYARFEFGHVRVYGEPRAGFLVPANPPPPSAGGGKGQGRGANPTPGVPRGRAVGRADNPVLPGTLLSTLALVSAASAPAPQPKPVASRTVVFDSTLLADAASIDTGAGAIPAGLALITVYIVGRTTQAVVSSSVSITLNNDTGSNYDVQYIQAASSVVSGGALATGTSWLLAFPGASMDAGSAGYISFEIPSYDQTTFHKETVDVEGLSSSTPANETVAARALRWKSTAAITRLKVAAGSGNLLAGTRLLIIGG